MSRVDIERSNPRQTSKHIVILGGGFAGVEVLRNLQKKFSSDNVEITLVSKGNFLLFTPMLPEVASGMIETRHIVTPLRSFCKKAKLFEANVESIDLENKSLTITHAIGRQSQPSELREHTLKYDYLVIALGSENNFFGMSEIEENAFTMKTVGFQRSIDGSTSLPAIHHSSQTN